MAMCVNDPKRESLFQNLWEKEETVVTRIFPCTVSIFNCPAAQNQMVNSE